MITCECGAIIYDNIILKNVSVIQINKEKQLMNIKCRKCKRWLERVPVIKIFGGNT